MLEKIAIIFLALAFLILYWSCKNLDKSIDELRDAYIRISCAYEEQNKRTEELKAAVRDILKDVNS